MTEEIITIIEEEYRRLAEERVKERGRIEASTK